MRQVVKLTRFYGEEPQTSAQAPSPQTELKHFQHVVGNVTQDALNTWAEIWGELQQGAHTGVTVAPEVPEGAATSETGSSAGEPFKPSCGWPEFMEKMWLLRHYLDFLARFSRQ
ncbi:MAG: hypothetical protein ABFD90_09550 [Phycisphaerales bacterium]